MKMPSAMSFVLISALAVGCASTHPHIPPNFDVTRATIVAGDSDPEIDIDGLSGKSSGAAVGAASGAGTGLGYAAIACAPAVMFYGACLAIVAPITVGVGTAGGAAIGAVATQSTASVEKKREMLNDALVAIDARNYLATLITQHFQQGNSVKPLALNTSLAPAQPSWIMRIALNEVATNGAGEKSSYFLKASATLEIIESGKEKPLTRKGYYTQTREKKTTSEWQANEDEPVPTVIEYLLTTLASDMLKDFMPNQMGNENQLEVLPLYAKRLPNKNKHAASVLDSEQINGSTTLQLINDNNENLALFDPTTGMKWMVVPSYPVNLGTAKNICRSLTTEDGKKYRVPSLREFEQLWKVYKDDNQIKVFNNKIYNTSDEESLPRAGYTKAFTFENGTSVDLYSADVACVSK